ncbi:MAG: hypothetical protein JW781_08900 [Deltaproteobacteria bacterium]|nr:hypothetical protein [Candidatus Anaeroferrophillacea bacterium]
MDGDMGRIAVLEERLVNLLDACRGLRQERDRLHDEVGRLQEQLRQRDDALRGRDEMLGAVDARIEELIGRIDDFAAPAAASLLPSMSAD